MEWKSGCAERGARSETSGKETGVAWSLWDLEQESQVTAAEDDGATAD